MPSVNLGAPIAPIFLENPPAAMPEEGTEAYDLLIKEAGPAAAAFSQSSYESHIAATRRPEDYPSFLDPDKDRDVRWGYSCLLYTSPSPRDQRGSRMPSSA